MIDTQAEFIMEVTDKTKADVKVYRVYALDGLTSYSNFKFKLGWYTYRL